MSTIKAIVWNGQVELDEPINLPDGTEVTVQLPEKEAIESTANGDVPVTPEEIASTLALMDQVQPFDMTDEERAAWEADRRARRELEKFKFVEHGDKLRGMWK